MEITRYEPGTPCWVELETTDTAAAKRFYGELFGWSFEDMPIPADATYTMTRIRGKDVAAISPMTEGAKAAGAPPHWNTYILVADVAAVTAKVAALGGTVLAEPFEVMDAGKMSVLQDPGGAVVMLWEAGRHTGAAVVNETGAWAWSELYTHDPARASAFYAGLLGWVVKPSGPDMPDMYENRGRAIADVMKIRPEWGEMPPYWAVYFQVDDVHEALQRARSLGANVYLPAMDMPTMTIGGFMDPQGASVMVVAMKS